MAMYLKPRRGSQTNAKEQHMGLRKGEIFLEFPVGRIGREPGRIVIGDGATSYDHISYCSTSTNEFQPFITDPSIYIPRFDDSIPESEATANYNWGATTLAINEIGNGSTANTVKLPKAVGAIKKSLTLLINGLAKLNNNLSTLDGNKYDKYDNVTIDDTGLTTKNNNTTVHIANDVRRIQQNGGSTIGWNGSSVTSLNDYLGSSIITPEDLSSSYATTAVLASTVSALNQSIAQKANSSTLSNYVSNDSLNNTLASYATTAALSTTVSNLTTAINQKANTSALSAYATTNALNSAITTLNNKFGSSQIYNIGTTEFSTTYSSAQTQQLSADLPIGEYNPNYEYMVFPRDVGFAIITNISRNQGTITVTFWLPFTGHQSKVNISFYTVGYKTI